MLLVVLQEAVETTVAVGLVVVAADRRMAGRNRTRCWRREGRLSQLIKDYINSVLS